LSEPRFFEGRPTAGIGMNIAYGSILFIGGLVLFLMDTAAVFKNLGLLCITTFMIGFGLLLFALMANGLRLRRLEIDDWGIRFSIENREKWRMLWGELRAIGTDSLGGRYPRTGFYLRGDKLSYSLNDRDTFGPKELLKEAYKEIILRSMNSNISVEDSLGWGQELHLPVRLAGMQATLAQQIVDGKWYDCGEDFVLRYFGIVAAIVIVIGVVLLGIEYLFPNAYSSIVTWGGGLVGAGVILALIAFAVHRDTPKAVQLDLHGVRLRFPTERIVEVSWGNMRKCSFVPTSGLLAIWSVVPKETGWEIKVPVEVGAAVVQRFSSAHSNGAAELP